MISVSVYTHVCLTVHPLSISTYIQHIADYRCEIHDKFYGEFRIIFLVIRAIKRWNTPVGAKVRTILKKQIVAETTSANLVE